MAKSKVASAKPGKGDKALTSVKAGAVTKSSQSSKAKSSKIAKETAKKADLKKIKEPESSEEEDSDSDSSASSASDSDSGSDSEAEVKQSTKKVESKANGKATKKAESDDSDSSEDDSDDDSSEDEKSAKPKANGSAKAKAAAKETSKAKADSSDESGSSDEDEDEEKPHSKTQKEADSSDESDESDESDSDDSASEKSDSDEEEEKPKKRKAEDAAPAESKKQRTEVSQANPNASKTLFVGSLSWNVDNEWLQRDFAVHGEVVRANVMTDRQSGRSKGFAYVEFSTIEDAITAHDAMKGTQIDGRDINVDYSQPRQDNGGNSREQRSRSFNDKVSEPSDILFVGNVAFGADESTISDVFGEHGSVLSVRLPTDPDTGNIKGFGYVQFSSVDEAKAAFEALNGVEIAGRPVRLDFSQPRPNNGGSPRGGRGGPRGGGRGGSRGGFGGRGGAPRGGRGGFSTNRGGFGDFQGKKMTF